MPSSFEMQPSLYHLGGCNQPLHLPDGSWVACGQPAVERRWSGPTLDAHTDRRRCREHAVRETREP